MLETPEMLGLSQSEQQTIHSHWDTFNNVQHRLAGEGFVPLGRPVYACPSYLDPEVLTAHNSKTLTMEFAKYKAWRDFTAERLVYTKQILLQTRNEMRSIEVKVKKSMRKGSKRPTKDEIQEESKSDPRYEQLRVQEQENQQLELMYEAKEKEFSSAISLISRVITMRGQDIDQAQRGNTIGAQALPPGGGFG
jgi:hypothetical protein